jgi:hypothetical protein
MAAALWLAAHPQDAQQLVLVGAPGMGLTVPERIPLKGWRHLPTPEKQNEVHRHNLMALMLQHPNSLDDLALSLHAANVARDRMPRRRMSSTDIVAKILPQLQVPVSAIYGEHDALYKGRLSELQAAMERQSAHWGQWHTVAGAGHWVQYEAAQTFDVTLNFALNIKVADSSTRCNKDEPGDGWLRMSRHHATQTAKSKLPDVQAPQPRRTIPNLQPLESQADHQRDRPITGQEPQHHQPRTQPWPRSAWLSCRASLL